VSPKTDISEKGLEETIIRAMTGRTDVLFPVHKATETSVAVAGGTGWLLGDNGHYDREFCVDLVQLRGFLMATQPALVDAYQLNSDGSPLRRQFLARLEKEVAKRGVIDVLRKGVKDGPNEVTLFYGTPTEGNDEAAELFASNRFSLTRQLHYSLTNAGLALDFAIFINGLPVATFELKNHFTGQNVEHAVKQYKTDRSPKDRLFNFKRCVAHFAVDDSEVKFCTKLEGNASWFLPFNKGVNDGAGNPPNPEGLKTAYLWEEVLTPASLTQILEKFAQVVEETNASSGKTTSNQIWPRYHQLDVVRKLLADVDHKGPGGKYLIQHSAGSGKSNSIAWLAHQLVGLKRDGEAAFDSIIVVTDRKILDSQIQATVKQFSHVGAVVGAVTGSDSSKSKQLAGFLEAGKKIIILTIQTFPFALEAIAESYGNRNFALIIDEAHSSQGGKTSSKVGEVLGDADEVGETFEDKVNDAIDKRKMAPNVSYFAFTATPKNKTLEMFGTPQPPDALGKVKHHPFHSYTMKQAIQEGFILDVLTNYTTVESYYKLSKKIEDDPEFDSKKARKKLKRYVEHNEHAVAVKAGIMLDHFHDSVAGPKKVGGKARAMVVCNGIEMAIQYFRAIKKDLTERKSPYQAIVAFSDKEIDGELVTESSLNGFPSNEIASKIKEDPYRILVCANKFQTGYDEPLLQTMYVDKPLSGVLAVQTLSRLNRSHRNKADVFVLDFYNDAVAIQDAFADYYRTTILSEETDVNKLHDLVADLDSHQIYTEEQLDETVRIFLEAEPVQGIHAITDGCAESYVEQLDENAQIDFKAKAKGFVRTYDFLAAILPYNNPEWEKRAIFLNFLVPKLPAPKEEDLAQGILESIDMDSYRAQVLAERTLALADEDGEVDPPPPVAGGSKAEPEMDTLSSILNAFNDQFGDIDWTDKDRIAKQINEDLPAMVSSNTAYKNAMANSDRPNAKIEHDKALAGAITAMISDGAELFKQFNDNPDFNRWLSEMMFRRTYEPPESQR
jgi:type I restriction enzyme R subunit